MRYFLLTILLLTTSAWGDSSNVTGSGGLSASVSIDFRIIIPPRVWRDDDDDLQDNFGERSGWQYTEDANGIVTLSNP